MTQRIERNRQTARYVGESAGFYQRVGLAGDKKDFFHMASDSGLVSTVGTSSGLSPRTMPANGGKVRLME